MKVAVLFSGGKDSTLTSFIMSSQGFDVMLVTFIPENQESFMLHSTALNIVEFQAKAMGFPIKVFQVSGIKEKEILEMKEHLKKLPIDGIASGAISSEYQKQRVDLIAEELNVPSYAPLWHKHLVDDYNNMEIILSSVSAMGFEKNHLGQSALPYLDRYNFFEGGDAETLVLDAPFFSSSLAIEYKKVWSSFSGKIIINNCELVKK